MEPTSSEPRRVLLVESDAEIARRLAGNLEGWGYDIARAVDARQAWSVLRRTPYSVVICDSAPDVGATELLANIREADTDAYTYVILLSDRSDTAEFERAVGAGADDLLSKPVEPGLLLSRMRVAERITSMQQDIAGKNRSLSESNQQLERANQRMLRELRSAARVQKALLPSVDFSAPGLQVGWRLRPCNELAGDILNCIRVDEHHVAFYVLDVSGHGVSSALLSVQVSRLMSPLLSESQLLKERLKEPPWYRLVEPRRVVERLNALFQTTAEMTQYFTMVYGLVHLESGRTRWVTAGHPGPVHAPLNTAPVHLSCKSHPVGLLEHPKFEEREIVLEPGDRIWFYSDGVTDAMDRSDRELGPDGLERLVTDLGDRPLRSAVDRVMVEVERWSQPREPMDDCTLLALERSTLPAKLPVGPARRPAAVGVKATS